jgi:RNA polymerase sigma-70 factor (ECF subfamily)
MKTPLTLIGRLQSGNCQESWDTFCLLYYPLVYTWCLQSARDPELAQDTAQEVFIDVFRGIENFEYQREGSFRAWLRQVMVSRLAKLRRTLFPKLMRFDELAATQALLRTGGVDGLDYQGIFQRACEVVRANYTPQQWEIFDRTHLKDEAPERVAADLGVTPNTIYIIRFRVKASLTMALLDLMV